MSSFGFNPPNTSSTSGAGLTGGTTASAGGLFGTNTTTTSAPTFPFSNTTASTTGETKPLFGATNNASGGNIFGNPAGTTSGFGFSSAGKADENKTNEPKSPAAFSFGGSSQAPGTPGTSGTAAPSLFGSTTPAPAMGTANLFGNPSTTPAGPPPQPTTFGASTGTSNLFGGNKNQQEPKAPQSFTFGQLGAAASQAPSSTSATSKANVFGTLSAPAGGTLFGQKKDDAPVGSNQPSTTNTTTASEAPKPSFVFTPPTITDNAATATTSLFGGAKTSTTTSQAGPAPSFFAATPASSQPASGGLFQRPAATNAPVSGGTTVFGGSATTQPSDATTKSAFSFPTTTTTQAAATGAPAAAAAAQPQKPLFPALGSTPSSTPATTSSLFAPTSTAATTSSGSATQAATMAPPTTTAPATGFTGFSFGASKTGPATTTTTAPPAGTTTAATAPTNTHSVAPNLGASTAGPIPPAQSRLKNKTMDEILNRWATDLTKYTKEFKNHAEHIAKWDQIIVDNSAKIDKLYIKTRTCEKQTVGVEMQLSTVENQQNELDAWLTKYEKDVEELLAKDNNHHMELGGPDQERERTYKLAEKLGDRLQDIGRDLDSMVEEVNAANANLSKHSKSDEPITQIVRILNSHLTQLQQIDQGTAALQAKVTTAQKAAGGMRFLNGGLNNDGRGAVHDFYRSYMGQR